MKFSPTIAISLFLFTLLIGACGRDIDKPQVQSPALILWEENKPLSHSIIASGNSTLSYTLIQTPDSKFFDVNTSTGVLSSLTGFDFENPNDADKDRLFKLKILIQNTERHATIHNLIIEIKNVFNIESLIKFPLDQSNMGGFSDKVNIRGVVHESEAQADIIVQGFSIKVNGVDALFLEDNTGMWMVEVPVQPGHNTFKVDLLHNDTLLSSEVLEIDNMPIPNPSTAISDGKQYIFALTQGSQGILRSKLDGSELTLITPANTSNTSINCDSYVDISLSDSGSKLGVYCAHSEKLALLVHDISQGSTTLITEDMSQNNRQSRWLGDEKLLVRNTPLSFTLWDINTLLNETIEISSPDADTHIQPQYHFDVNGNTVYIHTDTGGIANISTFDIPNDVEGSETGHFITVDITTQPENPNYEFHIINDSTYTLSNAKLNVINISTSSSTDYTFSTSDAEEIFPTQEYLSSQIVHAAGNNLIIRNPITYQLLNLDVSSNQVSAVGTIWNGLINRSPDISLKSDNQQIGIYDLQKHDFIIADLNTFKVSEVHDFSDIVDLSKNSYGTTTYDWNNKILYRSKIYNWGGIAPSDDAHVVTMDLDKHTNETLIDGNYLAEWSYFDADTVRMGDVRISDDPNLIYYSLRTSGPDEEQNSNGTAAVYEYDIALKQTKPIYTDDEFWVSFNSDDFNQIDEPFLSPYSKELNTIALTGWWDGYLTTLNPETQRGKELILRRSPYLISLGSDIDATNNQIFMSAFRPHPDFEYDNYISGSSEIIKVDILTKENTLVASPTKGNGLPLVWPEFRYDESRDLLVDFKYNHLFFIDPISGDRVLVPLKSKSN